MVRKIATTTKQHKIGQKNMYYCAKRRCILIRRPYLDIKEKKIITKSDVREEIKMGIKQSLEQNFLNIKNDFDVCFLVKFSLGIKQM